jgi:tetratricopeptide (TPR) repeat protein
MSPYRSQARFGVRTTSIILIFSASLVVGLTASLKAQSVIGCHSGRGDLGPCRPTPSSPEPGSSEPRAPTPEQLERERVDAMNGANENGLEAFEKGRWAEAIAYFEEALTFSPYNPSIEHNIRRAKAELKASREKLAKIEERKHLEARERKLRADIASDQEAIRRLGFERRAEDFEEWNRLSASAKEEFKAKTLDSLLSVTLTGVKTGTRQLAGLNPPTANRMISQLKSVGVGDPYLFDAIRRVAANQGKPQMAQAVNEFIERLGQAKDIISTANALDTRPRGDIIPILEGIATALSWGLQDPRLEAAAASAQVIAYSWLSAATSAVGVQQVQRLSELTTDDLRILKILSTRLQNNVRELTHVKSELAVLTK